MSRISFQHRKSILLQILCLFVALYREKGFLKTCDIKFQVHSVPEIRRQRVEEALFDVKNFEKNYFSYYNAT